MTHRIIVIVEHLMDGVPDDSVKISVIEDTTLANALIRASDELDAVAAEIVAHPMYRMDYPDLTVLQ